jgi:hypothetical protein
MITPAPGIFARYWHHTASARVFLQESMICGTTFMWISGNSMKFRHLKKAKCAPVQGAHP